MPERVEVTTMLCHQMLVFARAAQATLVGDVFDDAATGQGLLNFFLRALNCGAVHENEIGALTGLTLDELRSGSFVKIVQGRTTLS